MELEEQSPGFSGRDPEHHPSFDHAKDSDKRKEHCYELIGVLIISLWFVGWALLAEPKFLYSALKPDTRSSHIDWSSQRTTSLSLLLHFLASSSFAGMSGNEDFTCK